MRISDWSSDVCSSDLQTVRADTMEAASRTRSMFDQAAEVATAAEQSATAMRDAAETAAGLVRAIEQVRTEVESSAGVANLAPEQAGQLRRASCRESVCQYV